MGLLDRIAASREERRAIQVPWRPWDSPYVPYSAGGPAHPSQMVVGVEHALRLGPLYAGARLIADMVASLPIQQYRKLPNGDPVKVTTGQLLTQPSAMGTIYDWVHMAMVSLILQGNAMGLITGRDGYGYPTGIEWLPMDRVEVIEDDDQPWNPLRARILFHGTQLNRADLFHIRAFSVPGKVLGLSPLRLFMNLINSGQDALEYGASWYRAGGWPPGTFQNTEIEVDSEQADEIRRRLSNSIRRREPLVYGRDWDYKPVSVPPSEAQFLECAVGSSMFSLPNGALRRADELAVGDEVLSWDGTRLVPATVAAVAKKPAGPVNRIRTQCGRQLETSPQHPYWASRRPRSPGKRYYGSLDDNARWVKASDLRVGDYVRVALDWDGGGDLDTETAWALGALVGDGGLTGRHSSFTGDEPAIISRLDDWLGERGGALMPRRRPGNYRMKTGGHPGRLSGLRKELSDFGVLGFSAEHKRVPEAVLTGGRKAQASFLSGYLDTDGCVVAETRPQPIVYWASVSRRLLDECQHMLAMMGVQSAIRLHEAAHVRMVMGQECNAKDCWTLTVCGRGNVARLAGLLTPAHPRKAARLATWAAAATGYRTNGARSDVRWTRVVAVEDAPDQHTYAVTVAGTHTHVTEGLITHNSMQLNATQIAAILGLPPERIGGSRGSSLTYSTQEQESISLVTDTLRPWLVRFETALFGILPEAQYVRFNTAAMLKTTTEARFNIYKLARDIGMMTANEVRAKEEEEPLAGAIGDDPMPLEVLVAMARGIKEIPVSMEKLVQPGPADLLAMKSAETIAKTKPAQAQAPGQAAPAAAANGKGAAGNPQAAAAAARARWDGDYDLDPLDPDAIRKIMANGWH